MGLVKVGDRVCSRFFGKGTVKRITRISVNVEFDEYMCGHDCNGDCEWGHGWFCFVRPKLEAMRIENDDCVYPLKDEVGKWD